MRGIDDPTKSPDKVEGLEHVAEPEVDGIAQAEDASDAEGRSQAGLSAPEDSDSGSTTQSPGNSEKPDTSPNRDADDPLVRLARRIEAVSGNVISQGQFPYLRKLAESRAREHGIHSLERYIDELDLGTFEDEWRHLLPEITIKESFLFRVPEQFRALRDVIVPRLLRERPADAPLRVWSAGCARGEEPATLALVLSECPQLTNRDWRILATDLDESALGEARRAAFGERAMAQVPPHMVQQHFRQRGQLQILREGLRECIDYQRFNLIETAYDTLGPPFDIIFLRNVLIYFQPELQRQVLRRILECLRPDGYLFLGHSESMWQLSSAVTSIELDGCFAYQPRDPEAPFPSPPPPTKRKPIRKPPATAEKPFRNTSRIKPGALPRPLKAATPAGKPLFEGKLLSEDKVKTEAEDPLDAAVKALAENRLSEAKRLLDDQLAVHKADIAARALAGLIHDLENHGEPAVSEYRAALFLEPRLVQVRFLLANRLEDLGWRDRARCEYRQVLSELDRGRELDPRLRELLPSRSEIARRVRLALERLG